MTMDIHTFTYDHGSITVNVADENDNHIATEFPIGKLFERVPDAKAAWEVFGAVILRQVEETLIALLSGVTIPDAPETPAPLRVCRICQIREDDPRLFGVDPDLWQTISPTRAYCPDHRIGVADGGG